MISHNETLKKLQSQIQIYGHIVGAAVGSGMIAQYAIAGGADFILALSAGKYRILGKSSLASYMCYGNSNEIVMDMGRKEILPVAAGTPALFGLLASDPYINLQEYVCEIKKQGFSGIANYPTLCMLDGKFKSALEEEGTTYRNEVGAIRIAHSMDMFTVAFVSNAEEAQQMADAGADAICALFGLTKGGTLGAKKNLPLANVQRIANEIFAAADMQNPGILKMIYSGSANTPIDMKYIYQNTSCQGCIGGSTFDRLPIERVVINTVKAFKSFGTFEPQDLKTKMLNGNIGAEDYTDFVKQYIEEHYMSQICLTDLADALHVSGTYLSIRFKKDVGCSFKEYLVRFRMNKARDFIKRDGMNCRQAAQKVNYTDYAHFSKMFKKYIGVNPADVNKNT